MASQGIRIFGIDADEQHEHVGRFLEYLGGRLLAPRDAKDAAEIELHPDDDVVLDLKRRPRDEGRHRSSPRGLRSSSGT